MDNFKYGLFERLNIDSESTEKSYKARVNDFKDPLLFIINQPQYILFGRGPSKAEVRSDYHNGFTWIVLRFGIVGLYLYFLMLTYLISYLTSLKNKKMNFNFQKMKIFILQLLICWIFMDISGNVFKEPRIMFLNMIFFGIFVSLLRDPRLNNNELK
jgi:hypothetical protein